MNVTMSVRLVADAEHMSEQPASRYRPDPEWPAGRPWRTRERRIQLIHPDTHRPIGNPAVLSQHDLDRVAAALYVWKARHRHTIEADIAEQIIETIVEQQYWRLTDPWLIQTENLLAA